VVLENMLERVWRVVLRTKWMSTVQRGKGCQSAMKRWCVSVETVLGKSRPIRMVGTMKLSVMEAGMIRRSQGEMRRMLLEWVPGKGLEIGEVRRWMNSQMGTVTV
jgi:hypothetical protein